MKQLLAVDRLEILILVDNTGFARRRTRRTQPVRTAAFQV